MIAYELNDERLAFKLLKAALTAPTRCPTSGTVGPVSEPKPTQLDIDPNVVQNYINQLESGQSVPSIEVIELPSGEQYILDGHHRFVEGQLSARPVQMSIRPNNGPVGFDWSNVQYSPIPK